MTRKKGASRKAKHQRNRSFLQTQMQHHLKQLATAEKLVAKGRAAEALPLVKEMHKQFPENEDILILLNRVYFDLNNMIGYQETAEKLIAKRPEDADLHFALAGVYLVNGFVGKALQSFHQAIARFPEHEQAASARTTIR